MSESDSTLLRDDLEREPYLEIAFEHEVEPTEMQSNILDGTRRIVKTMCKQVGVAPIDIPRARIHIVFKGEFYEKVSPIAEAKVSYGHVYVAERRDGPVEFARVVTHELAHAASFYGLGATFVPEARRLDLWMRRLGVTFSPKASNTGGTRSYFNGFNEGVTERFAVSLRQQLSVGSFWSDAQRKSLLSKVYYKSHVLLVDGLVKLVGEAEHQDTQDVLQMLYRDYLSGTFAFLHRLSRIKKQSSKVLIDMDLDASSALRAAEALELEDCANGIRHLLAATERTEHNQPD